MSITITDVDNLSGKIAFWQRYKSVASAVVTRNATAIYNRGMEPGGTPVDTGELRSSLSQSSDEVGYIKDYAAHVEYGHRTVNGGYVEGQYYLEQNVEKQKPIYRRELLEIMEAR